MTPKEQILDILKVATILDPILFADLCPNLSPEKITISLSELFHEGKVTLAYFDRKNNKIVEGPIFEDFVQIVVLKEKPQSTTAS